VISLACAVAVIAMVFSLWSATGRAVYTQQYDPARAAREAVTTNDLASQFGDVPLPGGESAAAIEAVPNRFQIGLLPSTYPWNFTSPDLLSVLTIATPAGLIALMQIVPARTTRRLVRLALSHRSAPGAETVTT